MTLALPAFRHAWLLWATAFVVPWIVLFLARPDLRRSMLWVNTLTAPFGLTEPLFVPRSWNPSSLLDLAQPTGFDVKVAPPPTFAGRRRLA